MVVRLCLKFNLGLKAGGAFIGAVFATSLCLNIYFATHSQEAKTGADKGGADWHDVAKGALCLSDGDSSAILDALNEYDPDMNWFVAVVT